MGDGKDAKHQLQGWAIVENQTDNDWTDVQLSLVSGRPISFIQDLYQPLYIPRPIVKPELYASLRPQTYDAGMNLQEQAPQAFYREAKEEVLGRNVTELGAATGRGRRTAGAAAAAG